MHQSADRRGHRSLRHRTFGVMTAMVMAMVLALVMAFAVAPARADDPLYDFEPINYESTAPRDPVAQLMRKLDAGEAKLAWDERLGYLPALLKALNVSPESQMLVYSKTSFQLKLISPHTPRAVYFNDEVYIGYVPGGEVLEVSAVDPELGGVFYAVRQQPPAPPAPPPPEADHADDSNAAAAPLAAHPPLIQRRVGECLQCHASAMTQSVPGHMVRSVFSDAQGYPILTAKTFVTTHRSPVAERWGGWYVTGTHGKMTHLGNVTAPDDADPEAFDFTTGGNVTDLSDRIDRSRYPAAGSDLVALMVLEHQTQMHNLITRAAYQTRIALHQQAEMNRMAGRPDDFVTDSTLRRIERNGEALVRYMLFVDEAYLSDAVAGTSRFAAEFVERGARDAQGRSLRELDLKRYLFKYPCSYLIYSPSFDAMPQAMKDYVYRRLFDVLTGADDSDDFAMSTENRRAIYEILRETKPGLPAYWTAEAAP